MADQAVPIVEYGAPLAPDATVRLSQAGQRIAVPAAEAQRLINEGWDIEAPEVTRELDLQREAGTLGGQALTAAEGVASGLSLGLSDVALDAALGDAYTESRQRRAQVNDTTALVSQLLGAAAPALATGGSSGAASAGGLAARAGTLARFTPAGQVARLASRAGRAVESGLAREGAGFVRTMAPRAAGLAVEGSIEAAIVQAAANTSEAAIGDEQLTAERLLAGVPQAGLFGAGFGALFGAGLAIPSATKAGLQARATRNALMPPGAPARAADVVRASEHVAPEFADAADGTLVDKAKDKAINWSARLSGKSADDIRLAWTNRKASDDAFRYGELLDESVEKAATSVDSLIAADPISRAVARGELKSVNVAANIKRGAEVQSRIKDDVARLRGEFFTRAEPSAFQGPVKAGKSKAPRDTFFDRARSEFGVAFGKKTREAVEHFERAMKAAEKSGDFEANAYVALEELKRSGDKIGPQARLSSKAAEENGNQLDADNAKRAFEYWENLTNTVRAQLEDVERYGQAGLNQKARNAAITEFMSTKQAFDSRFVKSPQEKLGKSAGDFQHWSDRKLIANRSGIRSHLDSLLDNDTAYERNQVLRHLEARAKAIQTLEEIGELPEQYRNEFLAAKKGAEEFRALLGEQTERLRNAQAVRRLQASDVGTGLLNDATRVASVTILGTLLGGPLGAAAGATIDMLRNPYGTAQKIAGVHLIKDRLARQDQSARRAVRSMLGLSKQSRTETRKRVGSALTVGTAVTMSSAEQRKRSNAIERDIKAWQANPMLLTEHVNRNVTRGMDGAAPTVVTRIAQQQARLMENLAARLPRRSVAGSMLRPEELPPHDSDVQAFLSYAAGALNPSSLLEDGKAATLAPEAIQAVKDNWPAYWQHTRMLVLDELSSSGAELGYSERLTLSLLFDLPGDPALDPGFLQRQQERYAARRQQQAVSPPPPSQQQAAETAKGAQLMSDSIAQRI